MDKIPVYKLLKARTQSALSAEEMHTLRPAITRFDDSWQFVFDIERSADDRVMVFLPGWPDPWSGSVCMVSSNRVTPPDITAPAPANLMKRLGRGAADTLGHTSVFNEPYRKKGDKHL